MTIVSNNNRQLQAQALNWNTEEERYALEIRAEVLRTLAMGRAMRQGESDRLEIGAGGASDGVVGAETLEVGGKLTERVEWSATTMAQRVKTKVQGHLEVEGANDTMILAGAMLDTQAGGVFVAAGMSDDLVAGGGVRITAMADLWMNGLTGMEEKVGTAAADGAFVEAYAVAIEREYSTGVHNAGAAMFSGMVHTTMASGFRPMVEAMMGVRNLTPGGGGGGGGGAPVPAPPPAPAGGEAAGGMLASAAGAGRAGTQTGSAEDMAGLARMAEQASEVGQHLDETGTVPRSSDTADVLGNVRQSVSEVGDEAGDATKADKQELVDPRIMNAAGLADWQRRNAADDWLEILNAAEPANPNLAVDSEDARHAGDAAELPDSLEAEQVDGVDNIYEKPQDAPQNHWHQQAAANPGDGKYDSIVDMYGETLSSPVNNPPINKLEDASSIEDVSETGHLADSSYEISGSFDVSHSDKAFSGAVLDDSGDFAKHLDIKLGQIDIDAGDVFRTTDVDLPQPNTLANPDIEGGVAGKLGDVGNQPVSEDSVSAISRILDSEPHKQVYADDLRRPGSNWRVPEAGIWDARPDFDVSDGVAKWIDSDVFPSAIDDAGSPGLVDEGGTLDELGNVPGNAMAPDADLMAPELLDTSLNPELDTFPEVDDPLSLPDRPMSPVHKYDPPTGFDLKVRYDEMREEILGKHRKTSSWRVYSIGGDALSDVNNTAFLLLQSNAEMYQKLLDDGFTLQDMKKMSTPEIREHFLDAIEGFRVDALDGVAGAQKKADDLQAVLDGFTVFSYNRLVEAQESMEELRDYTKVPLPDDVDKTLLRGELQDKYDAVQQVNIAYLADTPVDDYDTGYIHALSQIETLNAAAVDKLDAGYNPYLGVLDEYNYMVVSNQIDPEYFEKVSDALADIKKNLEKHGLDTSDIIVETQKVTVDLESIRGVPAPDDFNFRGAYDDLGSAAQKNESIVNSALTDLDNSAHQLLISNDIEGRSGLNYEQIVKMDAVTARNAFVDLIEETRTAGELERADQLKALLDGFDGDAYRSITEAHAAVDELSGAADARLIDNRPPAPLPSGSSIDDRPPAPLPDVDYAPVGGGADDPQVGAVDYAPVGGGADDPQIWEVGYAPVGGGADDPQIEAIDYAPVGGGADDPQVDASETSPYNKFRPSKDRYPLPVDPENPRTRLKLPKSLQAHEDVPTDGSKLVIKVDPDTMEDIQNGHFIVKVSAFDSNKVLDPDQYVIVADPGLGPTQRRFPNMAVVEDGDVEGLKSLKEQRRQAWKDHQEASELAELVRRARMNENPREQGIHSWIRNQDGEWFQHGMNGKSSQDSYDVNAVIRGMPDLPPPTMPRTPSMLDIPLASIDDVSGIDDVGKVEDSSSSSHASPSGVPVDGPQGTPAWEDATLSEDLSEADVNRINAGDQVGNTDHVGNTADDPPLTYKTWLDADGNEYQDDTIKNKHMYIFKQNRVSSNLDNIGDDWYKIASRGNKEIAEGVSDGVFNTLRLDMDQTARQYLSDLSGKDLSYYSDLTALDVHGRLNNLLDQKIKLKADPKEIQRMVNTINSYDIQMHKRISKVRQSLDGLDSPSSLPGWIVEQQLVDHLQGTRNKLRVDLAESAKLDGFHLNMDHIDELKEGVEARMKAKPVPYLVEKNKTSVAISYKLSAYNTALDAIKRGDDPVSVLNIEVARMNKHSGSSDLIREFEDLSSSIQNTLVNMEYDQRLADFNEKWDAFAAGRGAPARDEGNTIAMKHMQNLLGDDIGEFDLVSAKSKLMELLAEARASENYGDIYRYEDAIMAINNDLDTVMRRVSPPETPTTPKISPKIDGSSTIDSTPRSSLGEEDSAARYYEPTASIGSDHVPKDDYVPDDDYTKLARIDEGRQDLRVEAQLEEGDPAIFYDTPASAGHVGDGDVKLGVPIDDILFASKREHGPVELNVRLGDGSLHVDMVIDGVEPGFGSAKVATPRGSRADNVRFLPRGVIERIREFFSRGNRASGSSTKSQLGGILDVSKYEDSKSWHTGVIADRDTLLWRSMPDTPDLSHRFKLYTDRFLSVKTDLEYKWEEWGFLGDS